MENLQSNCCDSNIKSECSYSLSYVYNMDTGLVEALPATAIESSMVDGFGSSSVAASRERPGGESVLPVRNGHGELTKGIKGGGDGLESGQLDNSQELHHQERANSQSEISQNGGSLFVNSAQTTHPINFCVSIADNDHELRAVGDGGKCDLNGNELLEKIVKTTIGDISYSHMWKHQEYQSLSVEYDRIEKVNELLDESQLSERPTYGDILAATDILHYEQREHEVNMISIVDAHKSISSSMAPATRYMNCSNSDASMTNYTISSTNLVVLDIPRRAEQCPENGEIIYVQDDEVSDESQANICRHPLTTGEKFVHESDKSRLLIPHHLPAEPEHEIVMIDDGEESAESRVGKPCVVIFENSSSERTTVPRLDIPHENRDLKIIREAGDKKDEFPEPPSISRQLGMFGTTDHDDVSEENHDHDMNEQNDDDRPAESDNDFHNVLTLHSLHPSPSTATECSHGNCRIDGPVIHHQHVDDTATAMKSTASSTWLSRPFEDYDHDSTSRDVEPAGSILPAVAVPSTQPIRPVALSVSHPAPHQLIACGMTGFSSAVPPPVHPHPMLPVPLPPLAVFTHPIHMLPSAFPWHIHSHVSRPIPERTPGRHPTNCPHLMHSATNTTTALNSTARLASSYPLLKRGRRPRRPLLTDIIPATPQETNHGTSPPVTKRIEANARERERVTHLNGGFEQLRRVLPWAYRGGRRVSKVDTLRAAISYIRFLQSMLVGAELSPTETLRLRNGIVLENTIRIVQSVQKAPYPVLPPGYRFVNPPPIPPLQPPPPPPPPSSHPTPAHHTSTRPRPSLPPPPPATGECHALPVPVAPAGPRTSVPLPTPVPHPILPPPSGPHPTLPMHHISLPMLPPQPRADLPPVLHMRSGYDGHPVQTISVPSLHRSHSSGIIQESGSTALSWLINFHGSVGVPPIDGADRDVIMLGSTTHVSTNQKKKVNHVTSRKKSRRCKATLVT